MSGIIWGYIYKNIKKKNKLAYDMMNHMTEYKIDKYKFLSFKNINFGCGLQYITEESYNEVLPYYDKNKKLIVTADAIIDNRKELLDKFELTNEVSDYCDSEYILMAYSKWGKRCTEYILGDYAFAIWDIENEELFCARDHVGKRTLYYYDDDEIFAFSTVEKPLLPLLHNDVKFNERWLTDYFSLLGVMQNTECRETIYKDIYQIEPAHYLILDNLGIITSCYWDPVKNYRPIHYSCEEDYIKEFLKIFSEAVNCRCRTCGEVGINISGGLDSSSVGVIASKHLRKDRKVLHSYTSVPIKDFINNFDSHTITDETNEVKDLVRFSGNIDAKFCPCNGINSFTNIDEIICVLEEPYKIVENSTWIYENTKLARKDKCKVLLSGQYGNTTISFGDFFSHEKTLIKKGKIVKAVKELNTACNRHKCSRKKIVKDIIKTFQSQKMLDKKSNKNNSPYNRYEYCPVKRSLIEKWNTTARLDKLCLNKSVIKTHTYDEMRKFRSNPIAFTQISLFDTKFALAFGLMNRDPTRDKRVIEFCLNVPSELYVKEGIERYLIRKSMEGMLPDCIRMNLYKRGLQAADWIQRLIPVWDDIYIEIGQAINDIEVQKYIEKEYVMNKYKEIEELNIDSDSYSVRMCLIIYIFYRFLLISRRDFKNILFMGEDNDRSKFDNN